MNRYFCIFFFTAVTFCNLRANASTVLPDACGANDVKFEVSTSKESPSLVVPEGKALLVFISTLNFLAPPPVRYGVDGVWAGAAKNKSYFTYSVEPGKRHLCYDPKRGGHPAATSVMVESGKIYFFEYRSDLNMSSELILGGAGGTALVMSPTDAFRQIEEDQGKFLVKSYAHATSILSK